MLFGYPLSTIYLTSLIIIGLATILYLLFSDLTDGAFEAIPFLDPAILLPFISITAAGGYLFEKFSAFHHITILVISLFISVILSFLLYYFLLVPLRSAEVSLAYTDASLEGQIAKVITPIPLDGFGEILIETVNGIISKRAASYKGNEIPYDSQVLIIEIKDNTALVTIYENQW